MTYREIPEGSVEIQEGLWAFLRTYIFKGQERIRYNIYSSEGYCFYNVKQPENYNERGELKSPEEMVYATFCYTVCMTIEDLNKNFISVPYEEGYEIV